MARAIDADELLAFPYSESAGTDEQIEDWIEECGLSDEEVIDRAKKLCWTVIEGFTNVIKTAPTLTPPNEWISVDDRLPEKDGSYLVHSGKSNTVYAAHFWKRDGRWSGKSKNLFITHWMPMPELPERSNNETD